MKLKLILFTVLLALITGCFRMVKSDVAVFHSLPLTQEVVKYAFLPLQSQEGSLEYLTYQSIIRNQLSKFNYEEAPFDEATVVIVFGYEIGTGKQRVGSVPTYGQTGVSSSTTYGTIYNYGSYGTIYGTTVYTPRYGVTGYRPYSYTEYMRRLWLHIVDKSSLSADKLKVLYEGNVQSEGSSGQLVAVMPTMIKALFKEFPGKSGSTRREIMPMEKVD